MTDFERIVIVGAGVAGLRAAERLRELDYDGELVIIGDEPRWPYHRPLVSKDLLSGGDRPADLTLQRHVDTGARWRLGTRAERLETTRKVVHLPGGEEIKYDGLIVATGVEPRHLKGVPRHSPRLHTLRTVDEALEVKKTIARSDLPIVVLGTGYIGCDVAASARKMGRDVTMVGRSRFPLRNLGNDVAAAVDKLHRKHRARMAMGTDIRNWITADDSIAMHTTDGQLMVAGCVILAVGSVPAVEWMRGSGLVLEDGVLCDSTLFAAGVSDVVVAGDCARWPNLRFDETPRRVEHWINAVEMGRAAAENLLVGREEATPFTPIPRVWSGQYGVRLQVAGMPSLGTDTVHLSDGAAGTPGVTGYVRNGRLVGVCGWDTPRAMLKWTEELHNLLPVPEKRKRAVPPMPAKAVPATAASGRPVAPPMRESSPAEAMTEVYSAATMASAGRVPAMASSAPAPAMAVPAMASLSTRAPAAAPPAQTGRSSSGQSPSGRPAASGRTSARHRAPNRRSAPPSAPPSTGRDMPIAASSGQPSSRPVRPPIPSAPAGPSGQVPPGPSASGHMPPVAPPSGRRRVAPSAQLPGPMASGRMPSVPRPSGQMPSGQVPVRGPDVELTAPVPVVRSEPGLPETTVIPNLSAPNLSLSNLAIPNIPVPDSPAAMRPAPPPARQRRSGSQPSGAMPSGRQSLPPMPPPLPNQHPSFPNMRPVQRPSADMPMEHPSFAAMRPVQRPPMEHPSFPTMRPVQRPPADMPMDHHPSFAAMHPVQRPLMEHPSFPSMHPVARPDSENVRFPAGEAIRGFG
jgi:NADPH-dependent 2,4-dienoyl-CoA reductase/sulfur reductase-like enzyme